MVHPSATGSSWNKNRGPVTNTAELKTQISNLPHVAAELSGSSHKDRASNKDTTTVCIKYSFLSHRTKLTIEPISLFNGLY